MQHVEVVQVAVQAGLIRQQQQRQTAHRLMHPKTNGASGKKINVIAKDSSIQFWKAEKGAMQAE